MSLFLRSQPTAHDARAHAARPTLPTFRRSLSTVRPFHAIRSAGVSAFLLLVVALVSGCAPADTGTAEAAQEAAAAPQVAYLSSPNAADQELPFSEAVRVGHMLYLAGQVGNVPGEMSVVEGGIQAEARQVMENISAVLERHGSSLDRVVKCTVMIDEIDEWGAFNEVYVEFFPGPKPARSAFGADGLALGAAVEVECWATVG